MKQLVKLHKAYESQGLVLVATLRDRGQSKGEAVHFLRSSRIPFTVTHRGRIRDKEKRAIMPRGGLFDKKGKLVRVGIPGSLQKDLATLMAREPHWLAKGRDFEKLGAYANLLKMTTSYGSLIKKLEKQLKKGGVTAEEAAFLIERLRDYGTAELEEAERLESQDASAASQRYASVAKRWKGEKIAEQAKARLKQLGEDKKFQKERKAWAVAAAIFSQRDRLVHGKEFNPGHPTNKKVIHKIRSLGRALSKAYPDSQAAKQVAKALDFYAIEL